MDAWLEKFALANFTRSADTAHDLKTPLNVAVLNLELLRMRVARLAEATGDEKITAYAAAIETELRRMARIFDAFFLMSTPPRGEGDPATMDVMPLVDEAARAEALEVPNLSKALVRAHPSRIRQALKLLFEGASKLIAAEGRAIAVERSDDHVDILMSGRMIASEIELTKIFKFYYTDPLGNPDLSLATARLIAETYGGQLDAIQERDTVILRLSLPLGDR
jgi:signal transduction histidine kinase